MLIKILQCLKHEVTNSGKAACSLISKKSFPSLGCEEEVGTGAEQDYIHTRPVAKQGTRTTIQICIYLIFTVRVRSVLGYKTVVFPLDIKLPLTIHDTIWTPH